MGVFFRPLNTLQLYLAASFIPPFVLSLFFFLFFLLTGQLFKLIQIVVNKDVAWGVIFELLLHIMISFLPMAIPLSTLFATIYCLNKLSGDSEIVAMRSFGLSKGDILRPFILIGLVISIAIFALGRNLIPHSKTLFKNTIIRLTSKGVLTNVRPSNFFTDIPNVVLFAGDVSNRGDNLFDVFIRYMDNNNERVIIAREGILIRQYFSETQTPTLRLKLTDGNIIKYDKNHRDVEKILFETYDFPIVEGGQQLGFVTKDGMRSNETLSKYIEDNKAELEKISQKKEQSTHDQGRLEHIKGLLPKAQIEYWGRFNTPLLCLVFIFLGPGLGIKGGRGKERNTTLIAIVLTVCYYALFFAGISVAKTGLLPAWPVVFLPTLLIGLLAVKYYRNVDWQA